MHKIMDFRSDTVTRPTDEMRRVIANAEVGTPSGATHDGSNTPWKARLWIVITLAARAPPHSER